MSDLSEDEEYEGETIDTKTQAELDEAIKAAQEEKDYQTRMRHLRKRLNRSNQEYEELKTKIATMKEKFTTPLPYPKICSQPPPELPPTLKRRKRRERLSGEENEEDYESESRAF